MTQDTSEQILESFLEELLAGRHPPDLTERIKSAWIAEKLRTSAGARVVAELVDEPVNAPVRKFAAVREVTISSRLNRAKRSERMVVFQAMLGVVAASILALFGWSILGNRGESPQRAEDSSLIGSAVADSTAVPASDDFTPPSAVLQGESLKPRLAENSQPKAPLSPSELDLAELTSSSKARSTVPRTRSTPSAAQPPLDSQQIVRRVNSQLSQLWRDSGVSPSQPLEPFGLAQKLSAKLTGGALPPKAPTGESPSDLVQRAVRSPKFAEHFSRQMVRAWLDRSSVNLQSPEVEQLSQRVAQRIATDANWNDVVQDVLGGDLSVDSPSATFVQALAGSGNHRLVQRLGTSFLNENLACVRCHDDLSSGSVDARSASSQETYWSMIAMLNGVNAFGNSARGERKLVDKQAELFTKGNPAVFFELPDHRMKAAAALLPDGAQWNTIASAGLPREALAKWIAASEQMDAATVNQVWQLLIGRPLVPRIEAIENAGNAARREMLAGLSGQFRAHGRNLRQLASWIAASDAFSRRALEFSRDQWLTASEEELEQLQLAELVFAIGPATTSDNPKSLENSLATVLKLRTPAGMSSTATTLAQPRLTPQTGRRPLRSKPSNAQMPPVEFAIHGEHHTPAQRAYVARLAASQRLLWEQRVEHIVDLHPSSSTSNRVQQLANELLQQHSGDAQATLLDLLWAVESSSAM